MEEGKPLIFAFSGKFGVGKTTAANAVENMLRVFYPDAICHRQSFATPLRDVLFVLTGVPPENTRSADDKARSLGPQWGDMTIGQALQRLGTDAIRKNFHPDTWVNAAMLGCDSEDKNASRSVWIFDDARFKNEAEALRERGALIVRIERPTTAESSDTSGRSAQHQSEVDLDDYEHFSAVVVNTGTQEEFEQSVLDIVSPSLKPLEWCKEVMLG